MHRPCHKRRRPSRKVPVEGTGAIGPGAYPPSGGGISLGPLQATTDGDLVAGQVIKSVAGGHITKATGGAGPSSPSAGDGDGDLVKGVAYPGAAAGAQATWYPTGTEVPIPGLPLGPIYRSVAGLLVPGGGLVTGDWTNQIGISDGAKLDVLVSPPFQWSPV